MLAIENGRNIVQPLEQQVTARLQHKIIAAITKNSGFLSFADYMQLALYDSEDGYYNNSLRKFGAGGDFTTAPEVSPLFAAALVQQLEELHAHLATTDGQIDILELGAGSGRLMVDICRLFATKIRHYYIVEISEQLRQRQQQLLQEEYPEFANKLVILTQMPPAFSGIILANEVFDALACEKVQWQSDGSIMQVGVTSDVAGKLSYTKRPAAGQLLAIAEDLARTLNITGTYTSEINLASLDLLKTIANSLVTGAVIIIDYGYPSHEYYAPQRSSGTLRGFFRHHQVDDVLHLVGLVDITASVDFTSLAVMATKLNLDVIAYTTQAHFLLNCGILESLTQAHQSKTAAEFLPLSNQVSKLTSPNGMGEVFKVLALSRNMNFYDWRAFCVGDRSHTL